MLKNFNLNFILTCNIQLNIWWDQLALDKCGCITGFLRYQVSEFLCQGQKYNENGWHLHFILFFI